MTSNKSVGLSLIKVYTLYLVFGKLWVLSPPDSLLPKNIAQHLLGDSLQRIRVHS
jgi:hypothetical protein